MNTSELKQFAQATRRSLIDQVSAKLVLVLNDNSAARRENPKAIKDLEKEIEKTSEEQVIEKVSYIWFNRFCALRFMDVNQYTRIKIVSPSEGFSQPEILMEAKQGHIDESLNIDRDKVFGLLNETIPSPDPQQEAYRLLVVASCNNYYSIMPFLFERISDYTELLMPEDLLSESSVLTATQKTLTAETCEDVEVIGWLYQFYISEKKDAVFAGLKNNKKVTPENIPAATQLFTPAWIVKYLVENSLGRLWMLNRPDSKLFKQMEYYIQPESRQPSAVSYQLGKADLVVNEKNVQSFSTDSVQRGSTNNDGKAESCELIADSFIKINTPEEIKICDPACGSGHMLVYAFELLYSIYEEEGYDAPEIPRLILENNLSGIEIDERAGGLAAFALFMKAREKYRRFFRKSVQPNICVLENISFENSDIKSYIDSIDPDLFTMNLQELMHQFEEADNFGSLIRPAVTNVSDVLHDLEEKDVSGDMFLNRIHQKVLKALKQADYLSPKYHVVIANPPYMGGKGMNGRLGKWAKDNYPDSMSDLFAMFIERNLDLVQKQGSVAMITMQSWMFLSSFKKLRSGLLEKETILSMAHFGARAFDSIGGEVVQTAAFVLENENQPKYKGAYFRLVDGRSEAQKKMALKSSLTCSQDNKQGDNFFRASAIDFMKIPNSPIAYWVNRRVLEIFKKNNKLEEISKPRQGATTSDNNRFLRLWYEIENNRFGTGFRSLVEAKRSGFTWFPYNKGGAFRRWYGNQDFVINYENDGYEIKAFHEELNKTRPGGRLKNQQFYFKPCVSWSKISSGTFAARFFPAGFIFDVAGSAVFFKNEDTCIFYNGLLNTSFVCYVLAALSPTLNFEAEHICKIPILPEINTINSQIANVVNRLLNISKNDWDSYETSWNFNSIPLLNYLPSVFSPQQRKTDNCTLKTDGLLSEAYSKMKIHWRETTLKMKMLEEENNRIVIEAYGLQDEFTPEVPLNGITLTCNPHYRYRNNNSDEELEILLLADTMREFISYSVGCMFGRYSINKSGLILANQGETLEDYIKKISTDDLSFIPDDDNVIPLMDVDWFTDDISERFKKFLIVTFGEDHYEENMKFILDALNIKKKKTYSIQDYFLKEFYPDHIKRYKKRPIYWMFSSPKGSFNALIYMHRYRPDTVSIVLNDYLREFRTKLTARKENLEGLNISASASQKEKAKALKDIEKLKKIIDELDDYERDILYPLATKQIEIDLDDGVKVNYPKFGKALKKVAGLS